MKHIPLFSLTMGAIGCVINAAKGNLGMAAFCLCSVLLVSVIALAEAIDKIGK